MSNRCAQCDRELMRFSFVHFGKNFCAERCAWPWIEREYASLTDRAREMQLIRKLTKEEVSSVTIHHPNPDFEGPDYVIDYLPPLPLFGKEIRYEGETILDCLEQADAAHPV